MGKGRERRGKEGISGGGRERGKRRREEGVDGWKGVGEVRERGKRIKGGRKTDAKALTVIEKL
jgi:hypothetical protein